MLYAQAVLVADSLVTAIPAVTKNVRTNECNGCRNC
jgi:hypothetical protein